MKGHRTYRQLLEASERLIVDMSVRRVGADGGRSWRAERLIKGTVSGWLDGRDLPGRDKLFTFLAVCGVPAQEWRSWIEAVGRARQATQGRAIADHDPLLLGVHPAIRTVSDVTDDGEELHVLTPYVVRDHDQKLRARLRDGRNHQMVVLIGGSSVGKTRACVEAVHNVLPGWPVVHPFTAEELLTLLEDGVAAGTVLWLNETQRYLQPPHGRDVAIALRRVLSSPARSAAERVVIVGSMWLDPYWHTFTRQPQPGQPDAHAEIRELLNLPGVRVSVAEDFSALTSTQRAELERLAIQDPRLATALAAGGERRKITQTLAGGPLLLRCYADLAGTPAYAVLTAAMDARRIGCESPLPATFLEQAAPGYLTPEQRAAGPRWLTTALKEAAQQIHGVHALTPVRIEETIDEADSYVLHDFLAQHALGHRRREPIPASLWEAATRCVTDPHDLRRIGNNADIRRFVCYAVPIYRVLVDTGDGNAARHLAGLLAEQRDWEGAVQVWRARADAGDRYAAERLSELLAERGDEVAVTELRARADAGDRYAVRWLADLLAEQGDEVAVTELRTRANAGNRYAAAWLAEFLAEQGDEVAVTELRTRADTDDRYAVRCLARLLTEQGDWQGAMQLWRARADNGDRDAAERLAELLTEQGDIEGAVQLWRARADNGDRDAAERLAELLAAQDDESAVAELRTRADADDRYAVRCLADLLAERGDESAVAELRTRADTGNRYAAEWLAELLAERGDEVAVAELRTRANADDRYAVRWLAELLAERGDKVAVAELRTRADADDRYAVRCLARLLTEQGDWQGAVQVWRARTDAGDRDAAERLAELLAEQGDQSAVAELRTRANADDRYASERLAELVAKQGDWGSAVQLWRARADAGDRDAAERLAELLAKQDDEGAVAELRTLADAGDRHAVRWLAELLAKQGDWQSAVQLWRARADAGDRNAAMRLAELLTEQGDWQDAVQVWRTWADAGDRNAAERLAELLAKQGDRDSLRRELYAGNTHHAAEALISLYAAGSPQRQNELNRYGLTAAGDPVAAR